VRIVEGGMIHTGVALSLDAAAVIKGVFSGGQDPP
jgi:hypothetical protein